MDMKKQLKPRLDKDEILISSIGLVQEFDSSMFENLIPLANGWCSKNPNLGICKKANACIFCDLFVPTPRHLPTYKLQLLNIEATIEAARANKMDSILENSLKSKEALERIIAQIEKKEAAINGQEAT